MLVQAQHQSLSQSSFSTWKDRDREADIYLKLKGQNLMQFNNEKTEAINLHPVCLVLSLR